MNEFNPQSPKVLEYIKSVNTHWKMRLWAFMNLPTMWYWGGRVEHADIDKAAVSLKLKRATKNPYKSIYFTALCGAGELSTGILAEIALQGRGSFAMLVLRQRAEFLKKATGKITFNCVDGPAVREAIQKAIDTKEGQSIEMLSIGTNADGIEVAKVYITWTFKLRK